MWRSHIATLHCKYTTLFWKVKIEIIHFEGTIRQNYANNCKKQPVKGVLHLFFINLWRQCGIQRSQRQGVFAKLPSTETGHFTVGNEQERSRHGYFILHYRSISYLLAWAFAYQTVGSPDLERGAKQIISDMFPRLFRIIIRQTLGTVRHRSCARHI